MLPFGEISIIDNLEEAVKEVLAGPLVFLIDGEQKIIAVDTRKYPSREPDEADIEKVTRGSRDGFVETLLFNVTLIRRRIRDPRLRTESFKLGRRSLTEVALLYIEDIVNPEILEKIRDKLLKIDVDGLPMAEKSVENLLLRASGTRSPKSAIRRGRMWPRFTFWKGMCAFSSILRRL